MKKRIALFTGNEIESDVNKFLAGLPDEYIIDIKMSNSEYDVVVMVVYWDYIS